MKRLISLAVGSALLASFFVYPGAAAAFTGTRISSHAPAAAIEDIFAMFPLFIWIIFAVIIVVIVVLALILVLAPGKKAKGGVLQQAGEGKSAKRGKGKVPKGEARPQPLASPQPVEQFNAEMFPPRAPMAQPSAPQPLSPRPAARPIPIPRPQSAPGDAQPPAQPQPRPFPLRPQPRPQPIPQTPAIDTAPQPATTPEIDLQSAQTRYVPPQVQRAPASANRAVFKATNLSIIPEEVKEDDGVDISVTVVNTGNAPGLYSVVFRINNIVENIAELSLGPGASQTTVCTVKKSEAGEYFVDVEGLHGMFAVLRREPAYFQISNVSIKPERVKQGQTVAISLTVTNTGERPGVYNANLLIKGMTEASEDVSLDPGETKSVTFNVIKDTAGFYPISIDGHNGRFVVEMDWKE
jgi:hypothetical protein